MTAQPIGKQLLKAGLINEDQLRIALLEQRKSGCRLGKQLAKLGFAADNAIHDILARHLGVERYDPGRHTISREAILLVPSETARQHRLLPIAIEREQRRWRLALASPQDPGALESVRRHTPAGLSAEILLASEGEIESALDLHYGHALAIENLLGEFEGSGKIASLHGDSPAVRLIDALLGDAVRRHASDLHFAPELACLRIRYRIDGILRTIRILHKSTWPPLASRLKILAGMNIAETRAAQDGHFCRPIGGREIDFRVAAQPTIHGENIVLRILDRQKGIVPLESLGIGENELQRIETMLARPEGLLLVTGPTGSGKTTTLYSLINRLNHDGVNIMTLEDPVEYPLPLLRQTSLSDNIKLDFAGGIRSMLRQDPDIVLIGEIRDAETAAMALRATLTGHRVFATLHAGNAISALSRLRELGIDPRQLHGNLSGIIAQRLLRRCCPSCTTATPERDCPRCGGSGYNGRLALLEILRIDAGLDLLLADAASPAQLLAEARRRGFASLAENGLQLVDAGVTTRAEVARVVDLSEYQ
ncbi:GspE/PulE family protein [Azonexus caeni]|jgi:general secretion pathway protein E/type IV pilus assembly protein PilB|uniref:GspE/PulE family protein n=1 Tax=Azonexus caeni TaxID=266126 RepID=UPI003A8C8380